MTHYSFLISRVVAALLLLAAIYDIWEKLQYCFIFFALSVFDKGG
jgi:hypothetical protein